MCIRDRAIFLITCPSQLCRLTWYYETMWNQSRTANSLVYVHISYLLSFLLWSTTWWWWDLVVLIYSSFYRPDHKYSYCWKCNKTHRSWWLTFRRPTYRTTLPKSEKWKRKGVKGSTFVWNRAPTFVNPALCYSILRLHCMPKLALRTPVIMSPCYKYVLV